jgi:hypothetical protein
MRRGELTEAIRRKRDKQEKRQRKIEAKNAKRQPPVYHPPVGHYPISGRGRIIQLLREESCVMTTTLSGIIENIIKQCGGDEIELINRWKVNRPDWFRKAA